MKKILCVLMAAMLMVALAAPALAAVNIRGISEGMVLYVDTPNRGSLNVRAEGNANAKILKQINYGSAVIANNAYNGNYLLVTVCGAGAPDVTGWVDMRYLSVNQPSGKPSPTAAPATADETVKSLNFRSYKMVEGYLYVAAKPSRVGGFVNLRWVPSTEAAVIDKMYAGDELEVIAEGSYWYQAKCADGHVGFIMKKYTEVTYRGLVPREAFGTDVLVNPVAQ